MGSYPAARAGLHHRSRWAAHDRRELCLPGKPAGRGIGVELAIARQAGEIAPAQSGHYRWRQAPERAARRVLRAALTATNIDSFLDNERGGCRVRIEATVLRQNAAVTKLFPTGCVTRHQSALAFQVLTYISIGFLRNLIYAAADVGVDHNMLLIRGNWAYG